MFTEQSHNIEIVASVKHHDSNTLAGYNHCFFFILFYRVILCFKNLKNRIQQ